MFQNPKKQKTEQNRLKDTVFSADFFLTKFKIKVIKFHKCGYGCSLMWIWLFANADMVVRKKKNVNFL